MNLWAVVSSVVVIAVVFVIVPVGLRAYSCYRRPKLVTCPEACRSAEIKLDAAGAALHAIVRRPRLAVIACSLWPRRRRCSQACSTGAMRDVPARVW